MKRSLLIAAAVAAILAVAITACGSVTAPQETTNPAYVDTMLEGIDVSRKGGARKTDSVKKTYQINHDGITFEVPAYMEINQTATSEDRFALEPVYPNDYSGIIGISVKQETGWGISTEDMVDNYLNSASIVEVKSKNKVVLNPPFDKMETMKFSGYMTDHSLLVGYMIRNLTAKRFLTLIYVEADKNDYSHESDFEYMVTTMRPEER